MYIKIFESRDTSKYYMLILPLEDKGFGNPFLENEKHEKLEFTENEMYHILDKIFKDKHASN